MFGTKRFTKVVPVLAGGFSEHHGDFSKTDSIGRRQPLDEPPKELVYDDYAITHSAPEYDFVAQVLGDSMAKKSLFDKDLVLCKHVTSPYDIRMGKVVVMKIDDDNINEHWQCFRNVESIEDDVLKVSSEKNGKIVEETRSLDDVQAVALYRIAAPDQHPTAA